MIYWIVSKTIVPWVRRHIRSVVGLEHLPTHGPVILAANHASWIDPLLLGSVVYRAVNRKVFFIAATGKYHGLGGLPITKTERGAVILTALRVLNDGYPLGIFPEGKTNHNRELMPGKTGVARLAIWSGVPVVPIGIKGVCGTNPLRAIWSFLTARHISLSFGEPIKFNIQPVGQLDQAELDRATNSIMEQIALLSGKELNHGLSHY
jgi:1-acyl-sn-glycerol-3-phosphate acyltransferase